YTKPFYTYTNTPHSRTHAHSRLLPPPTIPSHPSSLSHSLSLSLQFPSWFIQHSLAHATPRVLLFELLSVVVVVVVIVVVVVSCQSLVVTLIAATIRICTHFTIIVSIIQAIHNF
ncbi:hypothetical protein ACTXT7_017352, partial [Hymenolepis weldensis]